MNEEELANMQMKVAIEAQKRAKAFAKGEAIVERIQYPQPEMEREKDQWKHRSKSMRCVTCMWFVNKERDAGFGSIGRCRRHAPTMNGYPVVYTSDWCGDHRIDENKVETP
jgi:hypothetical protein